jgi:polyphosphate glucokinase
MKTLVIDVGGTNVKLLATGQDEVRKVPSGPDLTAKDMIDKVLEATGDWEYDRVSIGYPGPVLQGKLLKEPVNLGPGWMGYDFKAHFGKPVKVINDAAMQALGSYEGGRMLFLGLGTGMGSALVIEKTVAPMELGHLPYKKGRSYEEYVGAAGLKRLGRKRWEKDVHEVVDLLRAALVVNYVVLGGGNAKKLKELPPDSRMGDNRNAFVGGFRIWEDYHHG